MALHQTTLRERVMPFEDIVRVLLFVAAVIVVMLALNAVFGFNGSGPPINLTVDPAAGLGLPF
jgi:hypothetical protein